MEICSPEKINSAPWLAAEKLEGRHFDVVFNRFPVGLLFPVHENGMKSYP